MSTAADDGVDDWLSAASAALGVSGDTVVDSVPRLLDLARDVAHHVTRPAAPLTTFVVGLALGADPRSRTAPSAALDEIVGRLQSLIAERSEG